MWIGGDVKLEKVIDNDDLVEMGPPALNTGTPGWHSTLGPYATVVVVPPPLHPS